MLAAPPVSELKNSRGEFFDQENFNGRPVLVRFITSDIETESCKTCEVDWIAIEGIKEAPLGVVYE